MGRFKEIGACKAFDRNGGSFELHPSCWTALKQAFDLGAPFFEGIDIWNAPLILRLHNIQAIALATVEHIVEYEADQKALKAEEVTQ